MALPPRSSVDPSRSATFEVFYLAKQLWHSPIFKVRPSTRFSCVLGSAAAVARIVATVATGLFADLIVRGIYEGIRRLCCSRVNVLQPQTSTSNVSDSSSSSSSSETEDDEKDLVSSSPSIEDDEEDLVSSSSDTDTDNPYVRPRNPAIPAAQIDKGAMEQFLKTLQQEGKITSRQANGFL